MRQPRTWAVILIIAGGVYAVDSWHHFVDVVVHVGEVREAEEMRCCSQLALSWFFKPNVASAVCIRHSRDAL